MTSPKSRRRRQTPGLSQALLASCVCILEATPCWGLKTTDVYLLVVPEARSPTFGCHSGALLPPEARGGVVSRLFQLCWVMDTALRHPPPGILGPPTLSVSPLCSV